MSDYNKPLEETVSPERMQSIQEGLRDYWQPIRDEIAKLPDVPTEVLCEGCSDLGVITYAVPIGDSRFGKMYPCPDCEKGRVSINRQWDARYRASELPDDFRRMTFESFEQVAAGYKWEGKKAAYLAARSFAESPGHMVDAVAIYEQLGKTWEVGRDTRPKNSLCFYGPLGTGKSGLCASITNALLANGERVVYARLQDFFGEVTDTFDKESDTRTEDVLNKYKLAPVLWLDEANLEHLTDFKRDKFEQIARYRYQNQKPTLFTMNDSQGQFMSKWSDRAAVAVVAMAHWLLVDLPGLRRMDAPITD